VHAFACANLGADANDAKTYRTFKIGIERVAATWAVLNRLLPQERSHFGEANLMRASWEKVGVLAARASISSGRAGL
jgi:hypothetical protein